MRLRCLAAVLLFALAACGSSSAASEPSATSTTSDRTGMCGPAGAQTLAASPQARVYMANDQVYGCAAGGRSYRLGAGAAMVREDRVAPVAVGGRNAGYGLSSFGVDTRSAQLVVRNLSSGRVLRQARAADRVTVESFQSIESIVVRPDGAVAWISEIGSVISHRRYLEVHRIDARGAALLDSGSGIAGGSLRLNGSTVTWRDGSRTRSATLR